MGFKNGQIFYASTIQVTRITGNAGNREANEVENFSEAQVKSFEKTCQILGIRIFTIFSLFLIDRKKQPVPCCLFVVLYEIPIISLVV